MAAWRSNSAVLLKAVADSLKTSRVQTLINTHWHPEQTGSNEAVGKAGGTIISHEVTRLAIWAARSTRRCTRASYGPLPPKAHPDPDHLQHRLAEFAGEQVDYRYLPAAHTNGDLFIHFPKRNVIVAGGPVSAERWPVMDYLNGAFMHGFVRSYEILAEVVKPDTIIIPAKGPTLTGADIVKQKDMYWALFKTDLHRLQQGLRPAGRDRGPAAEGLRSAVRRSGAVPRLRLSQPAAGHRSALTPSAGSRSPEA